MSSTESKFDRLRHPSQARQMFSINNFCVLEDAELSFRLSVCVTVGVMSLNSSALNYIETQWRLLISMAMSESR